MTFDWHTHRLSRNAVVDIDPTGLDAARLRGLMPAGKGYLFSVGIHPWNVGVCSVRDLLTVRAIAAAHDVVAIGEVGLDTSKGSPDDLSRQIEVLKDHVEVSETLGKPLILHIVRRFPEIIRLKKELKPKQRWIIHGFRGKPELVKELLRHGFYLSFGRKYNAASLELTPPDRRLFETDTPPDKKCRK